MDRKKLEKEGILTQYILGELDMATTREVEQLLASDKELRDLFLELEGDFERMGQENAIEPPAHVKTALINTLESGSSAPVDTSMSQISSLPFWKSASWRIAASVALVFGLSALWLFQQWQATRSDLEGLRTESQQLTDRLDALEREINTVNVKYGQVNHPDVIPLVLVGNDQLPEAKVLAYLNHKSRSVVVNTVALPDLRNTQSYQMWADVDGEMIDMGILDTGEDLIPVKYIDRAESLNITVEPYGGSEHPTVTNLVSYVKL